MPSVDASGAALAGFVAAVRGGRVAHAYLIVGPPRGAGMATAEGMLSMLFCTALEKPCGECRGCRLVRQHAHEDVLWIEPESRSRAITVDRIRDEVLPRIYRTSFSGGWKAVVLIEADRLNDAAANAFLMSLEAPPADTLLLLLTDAPQQLLPTIASRCQPIRASAPGAGEHGEWRLRTLDILAAPQRRGVIGRLAAASALAALVAEARERAEETLDSEAESEPGGEPQADVRAARVSARVQAVRSAILETVLDWQRDLFVLAAGGGESNLRFADRIEALRVEAARLDYAAALSRVRRVEVAARQFDRNLPPESVFGSMFREFA